MTDQTLSDALILSSRVKDLLFIADILVDDPLVNVNGAMLSLIEVTLAEARKLDDLLDELVSPDAPPHASKSIDGDECLSEAA